MTDEPADLVPQLSGLQTEHADPNYRDIDRMSTTDLAYLMNTADTAVPAAVHTVVPAISAAVDGIVECLSRGGRLVYLGAGTAGRLGVIDAAECPPTFGTSPEQVLGIIAGGPTAIVAAVEGAEDDAAAGAAVISEYSIGPDDAVVGITASGRTPFVLAAVRAAGARGALTVGLCCNPGAQLSVLVDHPIEVPVGAEVIAGSTRLKAGTAQKLVLNMISTITMVKLGKTHGNLMVDLIATNEKLLARALQMVREITGVDADTARHALERADRHVKTAVLMIERDLEPAAARAALADADGRLAAALVADKGRTATGTPRLPRQHQIRRGA